ncbi:DUF6153 family protein [Streptomyces sp. 8N616]|uniref:DUF6153 family protein n=1 Tax=Streptomyces sp. 8N616 TaxID=3457414 RepID=UPI003FD3BD6F
MAARLLLVVVSALGVFVMHTIGHPSDTPGSEMSATAHAVGAHPMSGEPGTVAAMDTPPVAEGEVHGSKAVDVSSAPHGPGMAMDMASLCLAVLGAWALVSLLRAALASRREWLAHLIARALAAVRPNSPPPHPPDLARLSILRI